MEIRFIKGKALEASAKHFNNEFNESEMVEIVRQVVNNRTHTGKSDRANPGHTPANIIWGDLYGTTYQITYDSIDIRKGLMTVVAFFDVNPQTKHRKTKRFNLKEVN